MPNHVHLIAVPKTRDGLTRAIGEAHWRYTRRVNFREDWRALLTSALTEDELRQFREHERTGRVLGGDAFQRRLEKKLGRVLHRQKPGPKRPLAK